MTAGWPAPPATVLEGGRVRIEPLSPGHGPDLEAAGGGDPDVWRWTDPSIPGSPQAFAAWLGSALAESAAGREVAFAIVDRETGRAVGSTRFLALRPADRALEIGWTWLGREAWRTGINLQTKRLLLGHAFETLGCRRVELKTDARNRRSREAIRGIGARFEGIFRKHRLVPVARDTAWYAIVDDDWPQVRDGLEARIARREPGPAPAASHAHIDDLERFDIDGVPGLAWRPVRARFGILGFGTNAYTAAAPGDTVVEDHTEAGSGHEELYVVLRGRARFEIEGEALDAPAGTLVHVPSDVRRTAVAQEPGTTVIAAGGTPGEPYQPAAWEVWFRGLAQLDAGDAAAARETFARGLEEHPHDAGVRYYHAIVLARLGEPEAAAERLREAVELNPALADRAARDDHLRNLAQRA